MRVTVLTHHTHAGREYPAGAVLTLPDDSAEWLIALGVVEPAPEPTRDTSGKAGKKE